MEQTFSRIIHDICNDKGFSLKDLYRDLYDLDVNITYSSLYSYSSGSVIPPYSIAKEILKKEDYLLESEELEEILNYSKKVFQQEKSDDNKTLYLNLKIKPKNISKQFINNADGLKSVIEMRAEELFAGQEELITMFSANGKRKLSAYVAYLIKEDLIRNKFIKENEND